MIFQFVLVLGFSLTFVTGLVVLSKGIRFPGLFLLGASLIGGLLSIFPEHSTQLANSLGVGRGADLVLYIWSLVNLLFLGLILSKIYQTEQKLTEASRRLSVKFFQQEANSKK